VIGWWCCQNFVVAFVSTMATISVVQYSSQPFTVPPCSTTTLYPALTVKKYPNGPNGDPEPVLYPLKCGTATSLPSPIQLGITDAAAPDIVVKTYVVPMCKVGTSSGTYGYAGSTITSPPLLRLSQTGTTVLSVRDPGNEDPRQFVDVRVINTLGNGTAADLVYTTPHGCAVTVSIPSGASLWAIMPSALRELTYAGVTFSSPFASSAQVRRGVTTTPTVFVSERPNLLMQTFEVGVYPVGSLVTSLRVRDDFGAGDASSALTVTVADLVYTLNNGESLHTVVQGSNSVTLAVQGLGQVVVPFSARVGYFSVGAFAVRVEAVTVDSMDLVVSSGVPYKVTNETSPPCTVYLYRKDAKGDCTDALKTAYLDVGQSVVLSVPGFACVAFKKGSQPGKSAFTDVPVPVLAGSSPPAPSALPSTLPTYVTTLSAPTLTTQGKIVINSKDPRTSGPSAGNPSSTPSSGPSLSPSLSPSLPPSSTPAAPPSKPKNNTALIVGVSVAVVVVLIVIIIVVIAVLSKKKTLTPPPSRPGNNGMNGMNGMNPNRTRTEP
jgi:hypothetical protein